MSTVPIFDPQGNVRMIPADQKDAAIKAGGQFAVKMQAPDKSIRWVPRNQYQAAVQAGGVLAQQPQADATVSAIPGHAPKEKPVSKFAKGTTPYEKVSEYATEFGHKVLEPMAPAIAGALGGLAGGAVAGPVGAVAGAGVGGAAAGAAKGETAGGVAVEGLKQAGYEAGGRLAGAALGRIGKPLAEKIPAELMEKYPVLKHLLAAPEKSPAVSKKAVQYLTTASGEEAHAPIAATIGDIEKTVEQMPKVDRTVKGFLNVVNTAKDEMNKESGAAMFPIVNKQTVPISISDRIRSLITPNLAKTAEGRAEAEQIKRAALEFEKPWTYGELDAERQTIRARLNTFHQKGEVAQYTAKKANRSVAIDNAIEQGLKDTVYPEMDRAAGKPAGYFSNLKGRQSNLITLEGLLKDRIEKLAGKEASIAGSPRLSSENLSVSLHPGSMPRMGLYSIRNIIARPKPLASAGKRIAKAFPTQKAIDTMPYQVLTANLLRAIQSRPQNQ